VVPRSRLEASSEEIFDHVLSGAIKIGIERRYALADAAQAHIDLAGRKTTGSCILLP
jgi:NADPH2:quinone reductase